MIPAISSRAFSVTCSIRAAWILPSVISRSRAILAISLLTGSNPERITAPGVSSIIRSMPVAVSRALMLRPSLPIILPFISSSGSRTTVTVFSATWSAAHRWIAWLMMSLARLSAVSRVCSSIFRIMTAASYFASSRIRERKVSFACCGDKPDSLDSTFLCSLSRLDS